jgi:hypothetical protein
VSPTVSRLALASSLALLLMQGTACATGTDSTDSARTVAEPRVDSLMRRGLQQYFTQRDGAGSQLRYSYLRSGPTITGIAYPKYYVWIDSRRGDSLLAEGAARVALIDGTIEVTHFLSVAAIRLNPSGVDSVFPPPVAAVIRARLQRPDRSSAPE